MDRSFIALRGYAHSNNRKLKEVALALIDDAISITDLA